MKTAHIYLLVIGLLMYVSYSAKKDNYQVKQQEARVHRQFCAAYTFHPDCKWSTKYNSGLVAKSSTKKCMLTIKKMHEKLHLLVIQKQKLLAWM